MAMTAMMMIALFSHCTDEAYDSKYADPSKNPSPTCDKLMTGAFQFCLTHLHPAHDGFNWGHRTGVFAQTFGAPNSGPYVFDGYGEQTSGRWNSFYSAVINLRKMEDMLSKMETPLQKENEVFLWVTKIFVYHQMAELLVIFGDMPFTQAGTLPITMDIQVSTPKYDTQKELYTLMLADLKTLSDNLRSASLSTAVQQTLRNQDFINRGDLLQWQRLANSLRLRVGMRLSSQGELVNEGKAAVVEVLGNAANYPLPNDNADMVAYFSSGTDRLRFEDLGKGDESRILGWAAHAHVSRMVADNDPRLPITYEPVAGTRNYVGFDPSQPYNSNTDNMTSVVKANYSRIDSGTFLQSNKRIPATLFSAAEIWFLKAEAYQRAIVTGDAEKAFRTAVDLSINFYFDINEGSTVKAPLPRPSQIEIDAFTSARWNGYPSKEEAIATQKWLHFGFLQQIEAWTDLRRTGLPRLFYSIDQGATGSVSRSVPNRLRYPDFERTYNAANCPKVEDDKFETVLLWAKSDWRNEGVVQ